MSKYVIDGKTLTDIADAIRAKKGSEEPIPTENFAEEIKMVEDKKIMGLIDHSMTSLEFPKGITSIGDAALWGCNKLKTLVVPDSVTYIGGYAFYNCYGLTDIKLSENITVIYDQTFRGCTSLKNIAIPKKVVNIRSYSFYDCKNCLVFDFSNHADIPTLGSSVFTNINEDAKIIVPENLYARWTGVTNWSNLVPYLVSVGRVRVNTNVPNDSIWVFGSNIWGRADGASYVKAYYKVNGGEKIPFPEYNGGSGMHFSADYYENGYDFIIYGDATFTETGTYELWVEDNTGKKLYRRILEVTDEIN